MNEKVVTINGKEVHIYKWNLRKIMHNQSIIIPLVKEPLVNAIAMSDSGEPDVVMLSVLEGVLTSLEGIDFEKVADKLLEGVHFRHPVQLTPATIEKLEEAGLGLSDVIAICVAVIKLNYGDFLKKDLLASLMEIAGS
jgi:hypothetical protein